MKYFIKTFGCQQNVADSERLGSTFKARGMSETKSIKAADYVVINTCMVKRSAEDRVYGMVQNLGLVKEEKLKNNQFFKIVVTGCMVGLAFRDKTGEYLAKIRERMPEVDEFMPIEEVGFDHEPVRQNHEDAWVPISNGCNNFCTFCVVPFTRGREISRPFEQVIAECKALKEKGYKTVTLLGQNVNSYGADLKAKGLKPVYVKHLGRYRIPTLFPHLLGEVAKLGFEKVSFMSSNPWDFSDELIKTIATHPNITRTIHLPVQSGDNEILKRMNRWYTNREYLKIIAALKKYIPEVKITTDIIVGFCGETEEEFNNTVSLVKKVDFEKAYISIYSQRPMTSATKLFADDVPHAIKKARWLFLDKFINRPKLKKYQLS